VEPIAVDVCLLALLLLPITAADVARISPGTKNDQGFIVHEVSSGFQHGTTQIRVLLPAVSNTLEKYPAIYILPVELGDEKRYGDGLQEVKNLGLTEKYQVVFIAPTFSQLPWYADHPDDPAVRQESYFLHVVIPFVERTYAVEDKAQGRLLLGFSKSGWGAWSLLLRHPDTFGRAAAWDAPMMMDWPAKYGSSDIFATEENFKAYRIANLLRSRGQSVSAESRLILTGYANFRAAHQQLHSMLEELKIPHEYRDGPQRSHDWQSGWLSEAVELLVRPQK